MADPIVSTPTDTGVDPLPDPDNEGKVRNLAEGIQFDDPRMYDLLDMLIGDVYKAALAINPRPTKVFGATGSLGTTDVVQGFQATLINTPSDLRLTWNNLSGADSYEVRYKSGNNDATAWDTATSILTTTTLQADINPTTIPLLYGSHTFLIKAVAINGVQSSIAAYVIANVPVIGGPSLTSTIIDNFVLLKWVAPSSTFHISYYNVYKNGVFLGKMDGTFEAIFETTAGTYTYAVEAIDDVGNVSLQTTLTASVKSPVDFTFQDIRTSTFTGTRINCAVQVDGGLAAPIDTCGL
jgi:hypothetical protein